MPVESALAVRVDGIPPIFPVIIGDRAKLEPIRLTAIALGRLTLDSSAIVKELLLDLCSHELQCWVFRALIATKAANKTIAFRNLITFDILTPTIVEMRAFRAIDKDSSIYKRSFPEDIEACFLFLLLE